MIIHLAELFNKVQYKRSGQNIRSHLSMLCPESNSQSGQRHKKSHKCKFTPDEDTRLKELVLLYGEGDWARVAKEMGNRNARQCRERWRNYMNPTLSKESWTAVEDQRLLEKYHEIGAHWNTIARSFPNRSINCVRNRVMKLLRVSHKNNANHAAHGAFVYPYHRPVPAQAMVHPVAFPPQMIPSMFYFYGQGEMAPARVWHAEPAPAVVKPVVEEAVERRAAMEGKRKDKPDVEESCAQVTEKIFGMMPPKELADIFANPMEEFGIEEGTFNF